jgi:hypothetical protein
MPRRKLDPAKQEQKKIKDSLDSLLEDGHHFAIDRLDPTEMPSMKSLTPMDFTKEQILAMSDSKNYLDQMVNFYYGSELGGNTDHLSQKKKIDNMHLSSILLQMKTTQHAILKIMEEIEMGNMQPRMLEVLAQLQGQLVSYSKEYQNFVKSEQKMAAGAAQVKEEEDGSLSVDPNTFGTSIGGSSANGGIKTRGTKSLMENLQGMLSGEIQDIPDEDVEEEDEMTTVDARRKLRTEMEKKIENKKESTSKLDDDIQIGDELFN